MRAMLAAVWVAAGSPHGFELSWFTIDGGGGMSYDGDWDLEGVIAQPAAGTRMAAGDFELTGGFLHTALGGGRGADFNGDGVVDYFDFLGFVGAFHAGGSEADVNGDGVVDGPDYLEFVGAFAAGG